MKIAWLTDPHLEFRSEPSKTVDDIAKVVLARSVDLFLVGGDICTIRQHQKRHTRAAAELLSFHPKTLAVLGNHDLWDDEGTYRPPDGMKIALENMMNAGTNLSSHVFLEKKWDDDETVATLDDGVIVVVGSMGFPDFEASLYKDRADYLNRAQHFTRDVDFMNLYDGFLVHTTVMQAAFEKRLLKALGLPCKDIVVLTHYPILEGQRGPSRDDIGAYFFNWTMGNMVKKAAVEHPEIHFTVLAGHAHEYCHGVWEAELPNLVCYGFKTDYYHQKLGFFDLSKPTESMEIITLNA